MQIFKSERFTKEYTKISKYISECTNETIKKELRELLNELVLNVKKIDQIHHDLTVTNRLGGNNTESRDKILEIRKKIFKIIGN